MKSFFHALVYTVNVTGSACHKCRDQQVIDTAALFYWSIIFIRHSLCIAQLIEM